MRHSTTAAIVAALACLAPLCARGAARTCKVSAEYIYHIPANVSPNEARETALQRAKAQAIADEFGTLVTQSSSVTIDTSGDNSSTDFLSIGGSELKGKWLEDVEAPRFEYITDGSELALKVVVRGTIREIDGSRVAFDMAILRNGTTRADESDRFCSGDDMYLSFNSPTSGYAAVYLVDAEQNAYCLLPYQSQTEGIYTVKANRQYLFFHPDYADKKEKETVDEFVLETTQPQERNKIIAIFSPNRFYKAADSKTDTQLPRMLPYDAFKRWLTDIKKRDAELSIAERAITITAK